MDQGAIDGVDGVGVVKIVNPGAIDGVGGTGVIKIVNPGATDGVGGIGIIKRVNPGAIDGIGSIGIVKIVNPEVVVISTESPKEEAPEADDPKVDPEERVRKIDEYKEKMQPASVVAISRRE